MLLAELLEATMLIFFGLSWPMNAWKSYRARTAKGTSWQFLTLICLGYLCGIAAKVVLGAMNWVFWIYILNLAFLRKRGKKHLLVGRMSPCHSVDLGT